MNSTIYSRSQYLKMLKREDTLVRLVQITAVTGLLGVWELAAQLGWIDPFILSSPVRMVKTFITMAAADLWVHVAYTVGETLTGFALGVIIGFGIAVGLWYSRFASRVAAPFLVVLNSLPKIALGPVIIVWAGAGISAIITVSMILCVLTGPTA